MSLFEILKRKKNGAASTTLESDVDASGNGNGRSNGSNGPNSSNGKNKALDTDFSFYKTLKSNSHDDNGDGNGRPKDGASNNESGNNTSYDNSPKFMSMEERLNQMSADEEERRKKRVIKDLDDLRQQTKNYETYIKELIQNSIDAGTTFIDIDFYYEKNPDSKISKGIISTRDDGTGMSRNTIEEFLLKLYKSTKEDDVTKIGRFGVGFIRVFFQPSLDRVIVETNDGNKESIAKLLPPDKGWAGKILDQEEIDKLFPDLVIPKGTTVNLEVLCTEQDFNNYKTTLSTHAEKCAFIKTPLYVDGKQINKDFKLDDALFQISFGMNTDLEIVMGYSSNPKTMFFNGRLPVYEDNNSLFPDDGISIMVNSPYIDYNISRDDIIKNKRYKQILSLITQKREEMISALVKDLETRDSLRPFESHREYLKSSYNAHGHKNVVPSEITYYRWQFDSSSKLYDTLSKHIEKILASKESDYRTVSEAISGFSKKISRRTKYLFNSMTGRYSNMMLNKIPDDIRHAKIFYALTYKNKSVKMEKFSLDQIIKQGIKEKGILKSYISYPLDEINTVALSLISRGRIVIPELSYEPQTKMLEQFLPTVDVRERYSSPQFKDQNLLSDEQKKFLNKFREYVLESPLSKHLSNVIISEYSNQWDNKETRPFYFEMKSWSKDQFNEDPDRGFLSKMRSAWKNLAYQRNILSLNGLSNKIKELIEFSEHPEYGVLSHVALLQSVSYELRFIDTDIPKRMEQYFIGRFGDELKKEDAL